MKNKTEGQKINPLIKIIGPLFLLGPGLIASTLNNDASGLVVLAKLGQTSGLNLLWFLVPMIICLIVTLEMALRLGIATGKGLADLIREQFGAKITFYSFAILLFADFLNTTAELSGVAMAGELLGIDRAIFVPIVSLLMIVLITKGDYKVLEKLLVFGSLLLILFVITLVFEVKDWSSIGRGLGRPTLDQLSRQNLTYLFALVGTTVTPWMVFYFQSSVVEKRLKVDDIRKGKLDIILGGLTVFIIAISIIVLTASRELLSNDLNFFKSYSQVFAPMLGKNSEIIFALLLLNASLFSAILLPLAASYYICEGLGLPSGLDNNIDEAPHFFGIIIGILLLSSTVVLFTKSGLLKILIGSQLFNGMLVPLILFFLLKLCNDQELMGVHTNNTATNIFYGLFLLLLITTSLAAFI